MCVYRVIFEVFKIFEIRMRGQVCTCVECVDCTCTLLFFGFYV
jgi:hypothetical protein